MASLMQLIPENRRFMGVSGLLEFRGNGIYCAAADVYIDPWKPVERAVITHAHSDHSRFGNKTYLAHRDSEIIMRLRLGDAISLQTLDYNDPVLINGVKFSFHPAGHILGSSQVRVEHRGEVWVASGDYKLQDDGFSTPYENVKCDVFITESTFGLPIYKWKPQADVFSEIREWISNNQERGMTSILMGYSLGKMQRLIKNLQPFESPVYAHGAIMNVNEALRHAGYDLPELVPVGTDRNASKYKGALVLAPGSVLNSPWLNRFGDYSTGYCSGWMQIRGAKNRRAIDRGFVLSDHADWNELNDAVSATGAQSIYVTHGYTETFSRWLNEKGIHAHAVETRYGDDEFQSEEITAAS